MCMTKKEREKLKEIINYFEKLANRKSDEPQMCPADWILTGQKMAFNIAILKLKTNLNI